MLRIYPTSTFSTYFFPVLTKSKEIAQRIYRAVTDFFSYLASQIYKAVRATGIWLNRWVFYGFFSSSKLRTDISPVVADSVTINKAALTYLPAPFDPAPIILRATQLNPPIELNELITHFDTQFAHLRPQDILYNDQGTNITKRQARKDIINRYTYLNFTQRTRHSTRLPQNYYDQVNQSLGALLKAIIFELRKPELSVERKREALESLASAAKHCAPRKHEEAFRIYRKLSNQGETLDQIIREQVQYAKEELFRNHYSLSREPVQTLNYIRQQVGEELGLDTSSIHLSDPWLGLKDARSPENPYWPHVFRRQFLSVFHRIYTPDYLMSFLKQTLNERIASQGNFATMVTQYIHSELQQLQREGVCTPADLDALPSPYQYDYDVAGKAYHLTDEGIRFLLVRLGFLAPQTPHVHIVHAPVAQVPLSNPGRTV